jgi:hypothetical protein
LQNKDNGGFVAIATNAARVPARRASGFIRGSFEAQSPPMNVNDYNQ